LALLDEHIEGKYEILEKLREGGMGAIYKVRHRLLDELRVVKVIRSNMVSSDSGDRFLREARVAIRLRHPNIAQLHDYAIADDGNAYIVMELIDGWTLQEVLKRHGPPPISLSLEIARQSLKALGYLHRQKIVHRDVSPDNLMLTRDADGHAQVKLIDLGIAKAFGGSAGLTTTGIFLGKPKYASPEQFSGTGLDARSDLYSFGVVFYELLTGRCPIYGNDPASFMAGHLLRPPLPFAESDPEGKLPAVLGELLLKTLAKDPDQRFGSAEELLWAVTMVQDRFEPPTTGELETLLAPEPEEEDPSLPARPGSTQHRLDNEFWMTQTPAPQPLAADVVEPAMPPLGSSLAESVETRRLATTASSQEPAGPTRILPLLDEEAGRTRRLTPPLTSATEPAATVVAPLSPSSPSPSRISGPSDLGDLTWVTTRTARPDPPLSIPAAVPPAVRTHSNTPMIAAALVLAMALGGGAVWWLQRPRPAAPPAAAEPVQETPIATTSVEPAVVAPAPSAAPTEEYRAAAKPTVLPKEKPKKVFSEDPPAPSTPVTPMQRGDLIRRGLPNVQEPEPMDLPRYSYPVAAKGSGQKVRVRVAVLVDENGKVIDATVRESDETGLGFNDVALQAARKVPYQPPTRDDIPGKMWTELIFEFSE
jgi:eukaryotic-like serine/threonine-protein kinase